MKIVTSKSGNKWKKTARGWVKVGRAPKTAKRELGRRGSGSRKFRRLTPAQRLTVKRTPAEQAAYNKREASYRRWLALDASEGT